MRSLLARMRHNRLRTALIFLGVVIALVASMVVATQATSKPAFCNSCHEMTPFYEAWTAGPHASVDCVTCHVDPGLAAQVSHKAVALQEVYIHFTQDPTFPGSAEVPDDRCLSCHGGTIDPGIADFDHETHRAGKTCVSCHSGVGHTVTSSALADAGILDPAAYSRIQSQKVAEVGSGVANLDGHAPVTCSSCHDLAATGCASCHTEPDQHTTTTAETCLTCHTTDSAWQFSHPTDTECAECHTAPDGHYDGTCSSCHDPATAFAATVFTHPAAEANCVDCHTSPSGHSVEACATCHATGVSWKFVHPAASTSCTSCHTKPSGHSSATCSSCHQTGVSWKFKHPTSTSCASCHSAPRGHYGTACSSCHTPSASWGSATFNHPRVPGGEHTYRSFACANCHPSGYSSYSCLKCHDSNNPD